MSVQFILGRAGSGKTHHCLEAIRSFLRQDAVDGPQLLFLVPEQASLQMEQSLLGAGGVGAAAIEAYHRAQVVSFQRLAYLVLQEVHLPARQALSEPARIMVLRHLVQRIRPKLQYYRRVDRLGGFLDHLGRTISELIQESVSPANLEPQNSDNVGSDPRQAAKLHDLRLIYSEYLAYLGSERTDPSQHLELARAHLHESPWLSGAYLWVDGFASFSEQELAFMLDLARLVSETQVTALVDPPMTKPHGLSAAGPLFRRTLETLQRLRHRFHEAGIVELDPLVLAPPVLPRFSTRQALARLESHIFQTPVDAAPTAKANGVAGVDGQSGGRGFHPHDGLRIVELPSPRIEVDYAVAQICRWVQQSKSRLRYRDTAIIVRDLDAYHDLLHNALNSRQIPFFVDKRRPLTHHPMVELVRAAVRIAAEDASSDAMRQLLKTDLLPLSLAEADDVENHLVGTGIAGFQAWQEPWAPRSRKLLQDREEFDSRGGAERWSPADPSRARLAERLASWMHFASVGQVRRGPEWTTALRELLSKLDVGRTMARWTRTAEEFGYLEAADEHRQAFEAVFSLLDDVAFAFDVTAMSVTELGDVLEAALASLTLGLVPPTVDQVLVGAIERSRHPNIKAAVLVGFNDGVFPARPTEDSILNDDDRKLLRERGLPLAPPTRERVADESLLAYIAMTRASEELVITYSSTDAAGKPSRGSPFIAELQAAVPGLEVERIADPISQRASWDVLATTDLRRRLSEEFRSRPPRPSDDATHRAHWNGIYAGARGSLTADRVTQVAVSSLGALLDERLSPIALRRLFPGLLETSVSQLEAFAACPFKYFARHLLRLREREEADLQPLDVGQIHHAVLAEFTSRLMAQDRGVGDLQDRELDDCLRESCLAISDRFERTAVLARDRYTMGRVAQRLARVIRSQQRRSAGQNVRARASELPFGFEGRGLPALQIKTPAGRTVALRGFIDHVDLFELADEMLGIVVDYKARGQKLDMSKAYHGVSLQLLAYLLALADSGRSLAGRPIRPAGAMYVGIHPSYKDVEHPSSLRSRDAELRGAQRPRGIFLADAMDEIDSSSAEWSSHFHVYRKGDGTFGHLEKTDVSKKADFDSLLDHTRRKLRELADDLLDGEIGVKPCRIGKFSPCSWCEMASVCRFEMGLCEARFLEPMKRLDAFRRIAAANGTKQ